MSKKKETAKRPDVLMRYKGDGRTSLRGPHGIMLHAETGQDVHVPAPDADYLAARWPDRWTVLGEAT